MKVYITELIGTFFLTVTIALSGRSDLAPLAVGGILMVMVYAGGYISGANYNPAVTLAAALSRKIENGRIRGMVLAQLIGSIAALLIASGINGDAFTPAAASPVLFAPLFTEILFTMALCYVILHTAYTKKTEGNSYYGLAIGTTLLLSAIIAGPISGAVLNPAIGVASFVVGLYTGYQMTIGTLLLYIVGPFTGAILAAMAYGIQKESDTLILAKKK